MSPSPLPSKERAAPIQSLRAGVTPRLGARFHLVVGEYGSGKTFFLNLMRSKALERQSGPDSIIRGHLSFVNNPDLFDF